MTEHQTILDLLAERGCLLRARAVVRNDVATMLTNKELAAREVQDLVHDLAEQLAGCIVTQLAYPNNKLRRTLHMEEGVGVTEVYFDMHAFDPETISTVSSWLLKLSHVEAFHAAAPEAGDRKN